MDHNNEDLCCPICMTLYSEKEHAPRMLECGHTQCGNCIGAIMKTNKRCGECRTVIKKNDVTLLPINYVVLRVIETSKRRQESFGLQEFEKLEAKITLFLEKLCKCQKSYLDKIADFKNKMEKVAAHKKSLIALKVKQEPYLKKIPELKDKYEKLNNSIEMLEKRYDYYYRRINTLISKVERFLLIRKNQDNARQELMVQIKALSNYSSLAELSSHIEKTKVLIRDYETKYLWEAQQDITEEALYPLFENPASYFMKHKKSVLSLKMNFPSKRVMVKSVQSSSKADSSAKYINFAAVNYYATGAFIAVESQGLKEMLEIELYDNKRSQQFAMLCSGLMGKNFINTKFFNYNRKGLEGENISAGKVELKNYNWPATFLQNLPICDTEQKYIKSGDLLGVGLGDTVFQIYLEDWPSKFTDHCFGRLLTGRKFLQINALNGNAINVTDCGLIFDFNRIVDLAKFSKVLLSEFDEGI